ncbi:MAG TPA: hypothetical protein DIT64_14555, partial [Verrucomicrobiales bacterium]|nr:hypothetical protein [Verrucomicrobiales bacterium]
PALIESGCSGVLYRWNGMSGGELLKLGSAKVAELRQLFRHTGTIHSLLHFVWFCGIRTIKFIGCNGCNDKQRAGSSGAGDDGYDERLVNLSGTKPWWQYSEIRQKQDELCRVLGIHFEHVPMP